MPPQINIPLNKKSSWENSLGTIKQILFENQIASGQILWKNKSPFKFQLFIQ